MSIQILILLVLLNISGFAQSSLQGEYYFSRQELVAGFNFSKDGQFQFFYSYGAIDRHATGIYAVEGDKVMLYSNKEPGKDFTIVKQNKLGKGFKIKFEAPNSYLLNHILCTYYIGGIANQAISDSNGEVILAIPICDSIYVQHGLFPDIATLLKDSNNSNTNFIVKLNPSLEQLSFKGITLKIENENEFSCLPNYFLEMEGIRFVKQ
jgi:hypothetical protein